MHILIEEFTNATFLYAGKKHIVKEVKMTGGNIVIKTNRQTFVKTPTELKEFYDEVKFVKSDAVAVGKEFVPIVSKSTSLNAEIIQANSLSSHLTSKLKSVFDQLSDATTEETYKKASAMVKTSNAIAKIQMTNYKYLTLNK